MTIDETRGQNGFRNDNKLEKVQRKPLYSHILLIAMSQFIVARLEKKIEAHIVSTLSKSTNGSVFVATSHMCQAFLCC